VRRRAPALLKLYLEPSWYYLGSFWTSLHRTTLSPLSLSRFFMGLFLLQQCTILHPLNQVLYLKSSFRQILFSSTETVPPRLWLVPMTAPIRWSGGLIILSSWRWATDWCPSLLLVSSLFMLGKYLWSLAVHLHGVVLGRRSPFLASLIWVAESGGAVWRPSVLVIIENKYMKCCMYVCKKSMKHNC
jgi:hypothetical protein